MPALGNILDYIPQRPPFVMVDKLIEVSDKICISSFIVNESNLFCEKGIFYEGGMLETMAQTVAAGAGYRLKQQTDTEPKIGVIGTIKNLTIHKRPITGSELQTRTEIVSSFENAMVVDCSICENGITIAVCQMNIFVIENPNTLKP
jgi:predicted hotdog family 3-hydroxylacyl-ACP dehydratase